MDITTKITKEMLEKGYEKGLVRITSSRAAHDGNTARDASEELEPVAVIGEYWFYAFGMEAESRTVAEFLKNTPAEDIINDIYTTLEAFREDPDDYEAEYGYYASYLREHLQDAA